jgi:endopolyphosphatase
VLTFRNVDHFFFIDVIELEAGPGVDTGKQMYLDTPFVNSTAQGPELHHDPHLNNSGRYTIRGRNTNTALQEELLKDFGDMPKGHLLRMKDYTVMNVAPSIIPTYLPAMRIFT